MATINNVNEKLVALEQVMAAHAIDSVDSHTLFQKELAAVRVLVDELSATSPDDSLLERIGTLTNWINTLDKTVIKHSKSLSEIDSDTKKIHDSIASINDRLSKLEGVTEPPPPPPPGGEHKVIVAVSGSVSDVRKAIKEAGNDLSIVRIPPGRFNWGETVVAPDTCSFSSSSDEKPVIRKTHRGEEFGAPCLAVYHVGDKSVIHEFSKVEIETQFESARIRGIALCYYGGVNVRVHRNKFDEFGRAGLSIFGGSSRFGAKPGNPRGVSWNNEYIEGLNSGGYLGYGIEGIGNPGYRGLIIPGGLDMFYAEDEYFDYRRHATVANNNMRMVVRYCTAEHQLKNAHTWDAHGLAAWPEGTRYIEFYHNLVKSNDPGIHNSNYGSSIRGGGGVVFANTWENRIANGHIAVVYETAGSASEAEHMMWKTGATDMPSHPDDPDWTKQLYAWDNRDGEGNTVHPIPKSNRIALNRDVFTSMPPGYKPAPYPHPYRAAYDAKEAV